jgi:hypothetical protein
MKTRPFSVRIEAELYSNLKAFAAQKDWSIGQVTQHAAIEDLQR